MKLFSLISGKEVRIAPGQKKIPAKEFSTLQELLEILKRSKEKQIEFKKETAIEAEKTKKIGIRRGISSGARFVEQTSTALDEELKQLRDEIQKKNASPLFPPPAKSSEKN